MAALCEMFPEAPIFTLIYDEKRTNSVFRGRKIHTSFLRKVPGAKKFFRGLIWLMPLAIEQFDLSDFDVVISISHSFGKGIITKPATKHICYCLTPTRYLWHNPGLPFRPLSQFLLTYLRNWDYQAAQRPDYFIACSENVRQRIKKYYNRESKVIYPPVETPSGSNSVRSFSAAPAAASDSDSASRLRRGGTFDEQVVGRFVPLRGNQAKTASESVHRTTPARLTSDYFLMVSRLVPYKRLDIAIEAFSKLPDEKLLIIGDGPEFNKLEASRSGLKAQNIKFLGQVSDSELPKYYANCKALIFPQEEDFGIVPLEAMALGRPVIAYRAGGALETVKEGETGVFFDEKTSESLAAAVKNFNENKFDSVKIREHASKFSKESFKKKFTELLSRTLV